MSAIFAFLSWVGLSAGSAVTAAIMPILHEKIRAERLSMLFWLRTVMLIIALPVLFAVGWPTDPVFYVATFVTAFIWAYADLSSFRATEEFGPGPITRLIPLNVLVTFVMWVVIDPDVLYGYLDNPVQGAGIIAATCGAVFFAMRMQKNPITRHALRALGPVILMSGMGVVFAKIALDQADMHSGVFGYMVVQAFFMILIFGALEAVWHPVPRAVFAGRVAIQTGFLMGLNSIAHLIFKSYAYQLVVNPAYVSVVILTTPLLVLLYYRLVKKQIVGDLKAGLAVVACAAALVYFVSL
ncbi:MAG: hypothetical protein ACXW4B_00305 [Micavibrio sp.]